MSGQWIALDTQYFFSPLAARLGARFGTAGLTLWVAYLCAAKRARVAGTLSYGSDEEALRLMGLEGLKLVDGKGNSFNLDAFWRVTGQLKQTKRTRRGQILNVQARHWGHWQDDSRREADARRKALARAKKLAAMSADTSDHVRGASGTVPDKSASDNDHDLRLLKDPPKPPQGGNNENASLNGNGHPRHVADALATLDAHKPPPPAKRPQR